MSLSVASEATVLPPRRFEAVVLRWSPPAEAGLRAVVERACAVGLELAIIAPRELDVYELDARLGARPAGPGQLLLAQDRGARLFAVDRDGPRPLRRAAGPRGAVAAIGRELWGRGIGGKHVFVQGAEHLSPASLLEDQIARRGDGELPVCDDDPRWALSIDGVDARLERVHESLLTIADGRMGTRGSVLTGDPADEPSVLLAGVYAGAGAATHLLPGPRWNAIGTAGGPATATRRVLDLRTGTLSQQLTTGGRRLDALMFSSLTRPATGVLRVRSRDPVPAPGAGLQAPPGAQTERGALPGATWMRVSDPPGSIVAAQRDAAAGIDRRSRDCITCYAGASDGTADERAACRSLAVAGELGFDALHAEHRRAWAARWAEADVRVEGDPALQLAVRLALFHLIASVAGDGEAAVGARGLSGAAYRGHVFWDSDVYVLPFHAATRPAAARAMLEYRLRRLPAALRAARALGGRGARFPWESAAGGEDVTPQQARRRDGSVVAVRTGLREEHIVADVAWAAAHYADWTGDRAFATGPGLALVVEAARWWASRVELDEDGRGHIRDVIGPDEYHERVDDNAYTNVMARWTLRRAADTAPAGILDEAERRRWRELAEALVDGYDPRTGIYEQFTGFSDLEPLVIAEIAPERPVAAEIMLGGARTAAAQVVKQADVLMLHFLVPDEVAAGSLVPNLDRYEPRTAHGSTLSPGVHAALLARAGRTEQALELIRLVARIDLDDISQTTAGGVHMATMGSLWRAFAFGFAGMAPAGDRLAIDPVALPGLESLTLHVRFRGSRVRVRITPEGAELCATPPVTVVGPDGAASEVGRRTRRFELAPGSGRTP